MSRNTVVWLPLAFIACFLAVGIPYWRIPYSQVALPNSLYGPGLVFVTGCAIVLCATRIASFRKSLFVIGLSVPAAVLARVIVETSRDPTSHNLWPFEVAIALFLGVAAAAAGAVLGKLLARIHGT